MSSVSCEACGAVMFDTAVLDDKGHSAVEESTPIDFRSDDNGDYVECPACGAKNVVVFSTSQTGLPVFRVHGVRS